LVDSGYDLRIRAANYFDADITKTLNIENYLRIRRVKKQEKYSYGKLTDPDHGFGWGLEGPLSFVFECILPTFDETRLAIRKLATTLLLFKRDKKSTNELQWFRLGLEGSQMVQTPNFPVISERLDDEKMDFSGYALHLWEIDDFKTFWKTCTLSVWHPSFCVSSNRLLRLQERVGDTVWEDRLIDMMIACEALVLEGEDEKGKLIAHRVGKLQKTPQMESRIMDWLRLGYRIRNDIVHDGQVSSSNLAQLPTRLFEEFVLEIEQYLRLGMVNYIDLMNKAMTKHDIVLYLDSLP